MAASEQQAPPPSLPLHVLFFPFMAQGHTLPTIDIVKLFAARNIKTTIIITTANAALIQPSIDRTNNNSGYQHPIQLSVIPFPTGTGLPEGCENMSSVPGHLKSTFFASVGLLREPFHRLLKDLHPDCIVTAAFLPWTSDVAAELGIPRLVFYGSNFFSGCAFDSVDRHNLLENNLNDEFLLLPGLPDTICMLRSQIPDFKKGGPHMADFLSEVKESSAKSYGVIVNSFYELEPDYAEYYRNVVGRKAWHIGPVSLCTDDVVDKSRRGNMAMTIDENTCLKWLDSKSPGSVVYVCFGSLTSFTAEQLRQLALGLEAAGHPFVWVVRELGEDCLLEGFEERVRGRGLVIRGWAPQMLILNHVSVGGFLTHCGWNSSLEGISAGLPFITWPLGAEQFYNERLIVDVLKIGIALGVTTFAMNPEERRVMEAARIEGVVKDLMGDGEGAAVRKRAKELREMAKKAMEEGGSSFVELSNLIEELKQMKKDGSE